MEQFTVVGIGEILWDIFPEKPERKELGGAPGNFAYHVARQGCHSCVVSAVGNDALGNEVIELLSKKKLNSIIERINSPTGTVLVSFDEKNEPHYEICTNVAWDYISLTPEIEQLTRRCNAVCFGTLAQRSPVSRKTIRRFLELMPADSYKIFDINLRLDFHTKEIIHESLTRCNILKINEKEVFDIAEMYDYVHMDEEEICRKLMREYNLKIVILTKGAECSYIFTPTETSYLPTPKVESPNPVGAGDAFTGAFIAWLLQGKTIKEAHAKAVDVAAYVCTQPGAMPDIPV